MSHSIVYQPVIHLPAPPPEAPQEPYPAQLFVVPPGAIAPIVYIPAYPPPIVPHTYGTAHMTEALGVPLLGAPPAPAAPPTNHALVWAITLHGVACALACVAAATPFLSSSNLNVSLFQVCGAAGCMSLTNPDNFRCGQAEGTFAGAQTCVIVAIVFEALCAVFAAAPLMKFKVRPGVMLAASMLALISQSIVWILEVFIGTMNLCGDSAPPPLSSGYSLFVGFGAILASKVCHVLAAYMHRRAERGAPAA